MFRSPVLALFVAGVFPLSVTPVARPAQPLMVALAPELLPPAPAGRWVVVSNHNHTDASHDGRLGLGALAREAKQAGIDALVVTDHNAVHPPSAYDQASPVTLIPGEEWSSKTVGHAGLIGLEGEHAVAGHLSEAEMLDEAQRRQAMAVINHPFLWNLEWKPATLDSRIQGVEVWNNWWGVPFLQNQRALDWWQGVLRSGRRLTALGGGDYHGYMISSVARPVNLVWSSDTSSRSLVEAMRQGRVVVAADPYGPRVDLAAEGARIGDTLRLDEPRPVAVRVRVTGGQGKVIHLYGPEGLISSKAVSDPDVTFDTRMEAPDGISFVRAELRDPGQWWSPLACLTNPVWMKTEGY